MSLYEQYFSDLNKKYMVDLISNVIKSELLYDVSNDSQFMSFFTNQLQQTFDETNTDDIKILNKELLDKHIKYYQQQKKSSSPEIDSNIQDKFNELIQSRNEMSNTLDENKQNIFDELISNDTSESGSTSINELLNELDVTPSEEIVSFTISSSKRSNSISSRFNYKVDLHKQKITSEVIKTLSKVILPIEDNYIFSYPVIAVNIPELNYKTTMSLKETYEYNSRKFGIFLSEHKIPIQSKKGIQKITFDIRDISDTKYNICDILSVNIVLLNESDIVFTCSKIHPGDYQKGDYIKIINDVTKELQDIFKKPLQIKEINENKITCHIPPHYRQAKTYDNLNMKLMNLSNQNIFYFN